VNRLAPYVTIAPGIVNHIISVLLRRIIQSESMISPTPVYRQIWATAIMAAVASATAFAAIKLLGWKIDQAAVIFMSLFLFFHSVAQWFDWSRLSVLNHPLAGFIALAGMLILFFMAFLAAPEWTSVGIRSDYVQLHGEQGPRLLSAVIAVLPAVPYVITLIYGIIIGED
jgi:hypothetical protein